MATMDPSKTKEYMLVDPKTGDGHRGSLKFMYDLARGKGKWKDSRTVSELALDEDETKDDTTWQQRMSLLLCKLMWTIHGPLTAFGAGLVYILNLIDANDGVFKTLGRALVNRSKSVLLNVQSSLIESGVDIFEIFFFNFENMSESLRYYTFKDSSKPA